MARPPLRGIWVQDKKHPFCQDMPPIQLALSCGLPAVAKCPGKIPSRAPLLENVNDVTIPFPPIKKGEKELIKRMTTTTAMFNDCMIT